jgi:ABC-type dipeptide/oligopeptide/nickel transport system ATPase component
MTHPTLDIDSLRVEYPSAASTSVAVQGVSITVQPGERVGLVGESGSGKSTLAFATMGLLKAPGVVTSGSISVAGRVMTGLPDRDFATMRGSSVSMIYQDPFTFLNPLIRVGDQIGEVLQLHGNATRREARAAAAVILDELGLGPGEATARKYPHQLSGGQRQRVIIGMALVGNPQLVIADEPTTALDVTVQAQILRLLSREIDVHKTALLLISHDLDVIRLMCDRVYVMLRGEVVEQGPVEQIFSAPQHPYTQALLASSRRDTVREAAQRRVAVMSSPATEEGALS